MGTLRFGKIAAGLALLTATLVAGCGGDNPQDKASVNLPVSQQTRTILDADPPQYGLLQPVADPSYKLLGRIAPRSAAELSAAGLSNNLTIGGETTDRNFSTFSNWREFLGPLGANEVRIQSGWNDVEKTITTPPTYDFKKLDEIVDGSVAQKVRPFIFLGYGNENPGCLNCGSKGLGGAFPTGAGKDRFLQFVAAIVARYKDRVSDWQIWNEPNTNLDVYKVLLVDVAKTIKASQPNAKITIGSFLGPNYVFGCLDCDANRAIREYITTSLKYFNDNKGPTVASADISVGFHPYTTSVDYDANTYDGTSMINFLAFVRSYGFSPRMDENGAPSTICQRYALCSLTNVWSEPNQAKYNLRRVLGDLGRGIATSMFTITDLHYDDAKNTKGLLSTGTWDPNTDIPFANGDQTVKGKKIAFVSFQNVTALFDTRVVPIVDSGCKAPDGYAVFAWHRDDNGKDRTAISAWKKTVLPYAGLERADIVVECSGLHLAEHASNNAPPAYVDMMDGRVYSFPLSNILEDSSISNRLKIKISVGDWPALIADQDFLQGTLRK